MESRRPECSPEEMGTDLTSTEAREVESTGCNGCILKVTVTALGMISRIKRKIKGTLEIQVSLECWVVQPTKGQVREVLRTQPQTCTVSPNRMGYTWCWKEPLLIQTSELWCVLRVGPHQLHQVWGLSKEHQRPGMQLRSGKSECQEQVPEPQCALRAPWVALMHSAVAIRQP